MDQTDDISIKKLELAHEPDIVYCQMTESSENQVHTIFGSKDVDVSHPQDFCVATLNESSDYASIASHSSWNTFNKSEEFVLDEISLEIRIAMVRCFYASANCALTALQMLKNEGNFKASITQQHIYFFVQKFEKHGSVVDDDDSSKGQEEECVMSDFDPKETQHEEELHEQNQIIKHHAFICPICNETYNTKEIFNIHLISHSENPQKSFFEEKNADLIYESDAMEIEKDSDNRLLLEKKPSPKKLPATHSSKLKSRDQPITIKSIKISKCQFKCRKCLKTWPTLSSLSHHILGHFSRVFIPEKDNFLCPGCSKTFANKSKLLHHLCYLCKFDRTLTPSHQQTLLSQSPPSLGQDEPQKQNIHLLSFKESQNLPIEGNNPNRKLRTCFKCKEKLPNGRCLTSHLLNHFGMSLLGKNDLPVNCPNCNKRFRKAEIFYAHIRRTCNTKDKKNYTALPFACHLCHREFRFEVQLKHHLLVHSGEAKNKECSFCGKKFKTTTGFRYHLITNHTEKHPYQCNQCTKYFDREQYLLEHTRSHNGDFAYTCEPCGKQFDFYNPYHYHMKTVHEKKGYQCEICGKILTCNSRLMQHRLIHTGEMRFFCDLCNKGFIRKDNLNIHYKSCKKRSNITDRISQVF